MLCFTFLLWVRLQACSQHINWTKLNWREQIDPVTRYVHWSRASASRLYFVVIGCLQCFDAVGWAAGRASGLLKKLSGAGVVICLERGADLHMPSWCHCHSLSLASVKSRLVLPFWYWPTRVVLEKGPLNGCVIGCNKTMTVTNARFVLNT